MLISVGHFLYVIFNRLENAKSSVVDCNCHSNNMLQKKTDRLENNFNKLNRVEKNIRAATILKFVVN